VGRQKCHRVLHSVYRLEPGRRTAGFPLTPSVPHATLPALPTTARRPYARWPMPDPLPLNRLGDFLRDERQWYQLPQLFAMVRLVQIRNELPPKNPLPPPNPPPPFPPTPPPLHP